MDDSYKKYLRIVIETLFLGILAYSPIAFGSAAYVYRPPIWIASSVLLALMVFYLIKFGKKEKIGQRKTIYTEPVLALWLFSGYLLLLLFYLIPFPSVITGIFGGFGIREGQVFQAIHPHPDQGIRSLLDWFSAFVLFFVGSVFPDSRMQIKRIVFLLLAVAGFEAVYGMMEYASGHQHIFGYAKTAYLDSATGTFVNRNHFANYIGMTICLSFGVISYLWVKAKKRNQDRGDPIEPVILVSFLTVLLGAALLLSRSRAGLFSVAFALIIGSFFYARKFRKIYFAIIAVLIVAVIIFTFWLGKNPTPDRFLDIPVEISAEDSRPAVWKRSLELWLNAPVIGNGAGTFADVFRNNSRGEILARYLHAHNDYLQTLVETGILGFLLLFSGIGVTVYMIAAGIGKRESRFAKYYGQAMLLAVLVLLAHSIFDFNLQIPANRLTFFAILGLGYLTSRGRMKR